jgi:hypothetical protein
MVHRTSGRRGFTRVNTKPVTQCAIVLTTVNPPTAAVQALARDKDRLAACLILVGDEKSPADFHQPGAVYLDLKSQLSLGFALARQAPTRHYARKNIGYLEAIRRGARVIVETDDDNLPLAGFWQARSLFVDAPVLRDAGWVNVYRHFTGRRVWPRGLPLSEVNAAPASLILPEAERVACPIQQGLAEGDPDVDAVWRLVCDDPVVTFEPGRSVVLAAGSWCPFNSQNTTWWPDAFALLYLPSYCSFRMTDIWRSFVAQRIAGANGWGVLFTSPTVVQERNPHDLMRDFADEIPGYLNNAAIRTVLDSVEIEAGPEQIPDSLIRCYQKLVAMNVLDTAELGLLDTWLKDLAVARLAAVF